MGSHPTVASPCIGCPGTTWGEALIPFHSTGATSRLTSPRSRALQPGTLGRRPLPAAPGLPPGLHRGFGDPFGLSRSARRRDECVHRGSIESRKVCNLGRVDPPLRSLTLGDEVLRYAEGDSDVNLPEPGTLPRFT